MSRSCIGVESALPCPECGLPLPVCDHVAPRTWRHLDSGSFLTRVHAHPPRPLPVARHPADPGSLGASPLAVHHSFRALGH